MLGLDFMVLQAAIVQVHFADVGKSKLYSCLVPVQNTLKLFVPMVLVSDETVRTLDSFDCHIAW